MKYPEYRLSMEAALPSSVQKWLGQQLELRGIDSLIYTRYIISLLQQDPEDLDGYDNELDLFFTTKLDIKRWKEKKVEKKKNVVSEEEQKKKAAIECLTAVSDEKCGIEKLVEELCIRLKDTESQVSVSPFVNIQSSSSSYESSEESGPEFQNPVQRYFAAFPDLHGNKSTASFSPSVTTKSSVWKQNPLVRPCSGENKSENATASPDENQPLEKTTRSPKQVTARCNSKRKDGSFEKQRHSSKSYQTKPSKGKRDKDRLKRRSYRKDERLQSWPPDTETSEFDLPGTETSDFDPFFVPDNFEQYIYQTNTPKRENEELCTKVESILKGMLLPAPCKTYKELEDVDEGEPKEQLERATKHQSPISQPSISREDSVSPEHQEQDIWYTQPINIIFQSQEENSVPAKPRLYKRTSHPDSLTESGKEDSASTSSSPVCNRIRNDSTASDEDDDDIWAGSVLIPAWLTDELSIDHDEILPGTVAFSSSLKSSSPNEELLPASNKNTKSVEKRNDEQEQFASDIWSLPDSFQKDTATEGKVWSANDDGEEYLTPTPTQDLLLMSQQKSNENSQNLYWFTPTAPVSLIDVDYLSSLMRLNVDSQCNTNGLVDRTPCLSSLWQSRILFDISLYNTEQFDPEFEGLETSKCIWQYDKECLGDKLAKLWNVNMQKRHKGPVWGSDTDKDSHIWVGENAFVMSDAQWNNCTIDEVVKQQCIQDFENTLIPEIFIEIFNDNNLDDDVFEESEARNIKPLFDRSVSMNNVPSLWSSVSVKGSNPELSKSFELVPSETSAFEDVPRKLHHVLSEPNLAKYRKDKDSVQSSPQEHLYFSPKTHFRPITPAYAPELCTKSKQQICNDLFGGITSSKTPYQQYVTDPTSDDEAFVPKFKVKNYDKNIQTGDMEENRDISTSPAENPNLEEELSTPENLTIGMIEDIVNDTDAMDDYLIRIYEDLDAANNDSAYETDYGISTIEAEQEKGKDKCCTHKHAIDNSQPEKYADNVKHGNVGEKFDYGITSLAATYPHFQDWPDILYSYQNPDDLNKERVEKQLAKSWHEPSYYDEEAWPTGLEFNDASYITDSQNARAVDAHDIWSCDPDDQHVNLLEKYKTIWSTGQESSEMELKDGEMFENDFLSVAKLFDEDQIGDEKREDELDLNEHFFEVSDGQNEQFIDGRVNPVLERNTQAEQGLPQESFFSIKLVNKDKVRSRGVRDQGKLSEARNGNSYGTYDLMPMPDEALFSAELEKEWTGPEMQLLLSQHKHSRFQRKPCSFFLEGNCRRSDCKFAHDISNITCRFWEEGGCFKGPLCPFLHGYRSEQVQSDETNNKTTSATVAVSKDKFDLHSDEFPELSSLKPCVNTKRAKSGRSQNSNSSTSKKDKSKRGSNSRRSSNKENLPDTKKD